MSSSANTKVTIAIVTFNHRRFIRQCLDSIYAGTICDSKRVVVVDNCSSDSSAEAVRESYSSVTLVEQPQPTSFAANNNLAFQRYPSEYFFMLNPDTVLCRNALDKLMSFMDDHPQCAACGPQLVFPDGALQYSCRRFPTVLSTCIRRTPVRLLLPALYRARKHLMVEERHDETMSVDWMLGAALLIRTAAIRGPRIMDDAYPLYCEDIDLCYRLSKFGWHTYYVPSARIVHHHLARSDKKLLCRETWLHMRSMLHFVAKHYVGFGAGNSDVRKWDSVVYNGRHIGQTSSKSVKVA